MTHCRPHLYQTVPYTPGSDYLHYNRTKCPAYWRSPHRHLRSAAPSGQTGCRAPDASALTIRFRLLCSAGSPAHCLFPVPRQNPYLLQRLCQCCFRQSSMRFHFPYPEPASAAYLPPVSEYPSAQPWCRSW